MRGNEGRPEACRSDRTQLELRRALMHAVSSVVQSSQVPPLEALLLAATTLGAIYRDTAAAHRGHHGCNCGWIPDGDADVGQLLCALGEAAQGAAARHRPTNGLSGRA
jgi:hypothetical protein